MTIDDLRKKLQETFDALDEAGVDDRGSRDLHILLLQLQQQLAVAAFDPLKELDGVTIADTSRLAGLCAEVQNVIDDENRRIQLVERIVATGKIALRAAGIPIP